MTREEAIGYLKAIKKGNYLGGIIDNPSDEVTAFDMAIKALQQEPCEDAISRKRALEELKESAEYHASDSREETLLRRDRDIIRALPSVEPVSCIATVKISKEDLQEIADESKRNHSRAQER